MKAKIILITRLFQNRSQTTDDSGGDNNILVDADTPTADRPQSPFDWRQVQVGNNSENE